MFARRLAIPALVVTAFVVASQAAAQSPATPTAKALAAVKRAPITVGAILPLTGPDSSFGTTQRAAIEIADADAKRQGIAAPRIVFGDSQMKKDLALKEFRRLVDQERVAAFVEVSGSGPALALERVAAKDEVPIVSGLDTSPALTAGGGPYFFRVIPSDAYSSQVLSAWAFEKGLKKAALIVNQQNDWAVGFRDSAKSAFRAKGGDLPDDAIISVTDDTTNFAAAISQLRSHNPQAVFVGLMGRQAGLFVKQAVDKGLPGPFLGVDNLSQQEFVDNAGEARTAARFVLPAELKSDAVRTFGVAFRDKTGREADGIAFKTYDSYWAVLRAIQVVEKSGQPVTGASIQKALSALDFVGLTGPIAFDSNNDLKQASYDRLAYDAAGSKVAAP